MFSVGVVLLLIGFAGFRLTRPVWPWDKASRWCDAWFAVFLSGAMLIVVSICAFAWRVLP